MWPFDPWVASLFRILPITWLCRLRKTLPCSGEERLIRQLFVKGLVGQLACKVIWVCVSAGQLATGGKRVGVIVCVWGSKRGRESVYSNPWATASNKRVIYQRDCTSQTKHPSSLGLSWQHWKMDAPLGPDEHGYLRRGKCVWKP